MPLGLQASPPGVGETEGLLERFRQAGGVFAEISPELAQWIDFFGRLGLTIEQSTVLARRAEAEKTPLLRALAVSGLVPETRIYRELAATLGVAFEDGIDPDRLMLRGRDMETLLRRRGDKPLIARMDVKGEATVYLLAPAALNLPRTLARLHRDPSLVARIRIVAPGVLRRAIAERAEGRSRRRAEENLFRKFPDCSARFVVNSWQGTLMGAVLIGLPVSTMSFPYATELAVHLFFSVFFFLCVALRLWAAAAFEPRPLTGIGAYVPDQFPTYSILVALYREAEIIPDLLTALGRIVWPRSRLEIKLVCEADDAETLGAIEAHGLKPFAEIIRVPAGTLRTKPRALTYALAMTSGDLVALYDAEDRPHPLQLIEAWQKFVIADSSLACVQAPLVVSNYRRGNIARMFAFEYAALFRALLPWLARRGLVLPLGGTSNHFRHTALEAVGGWDPHNVTEDADLGLRLARFGYRTEMISRPTYEDAPETIATWLPQRTRWFKGWMQSWLVHMRRPLTLWRELGPASFLVCQILFAGMVLSAIGHPVFLATIVYELAQIGDGAGLDGWQSTLFAFDCCNIFLGYTAFLLLGWQALGAQEKAGFWRTVLLTPFYWFLMSVAAFRAVWKLYSVPHQWEKTPHFRRERVTGRVRPNADEGISPQSAVRNPDPSPMIAGSSSPIAERSRSA